MKEIDELNEVLVNIDSGVKELSLDELKDLNTLRISIAELIYMRAHNKEINRKVSEVIEFCESRFNGPLSHKIYKGYHRIDKQDVLTIPRYVEVYDCDGKLVRTRDLV